MPDMAQELAVLRARNGQEAAVKYASVDAEGRKAPVVSGRPWWLDDPTFRVVPFFGGEGGLDLPRAGPDHRWVVLGYGFGGGNFIDHNNNNVYILGSQPFAGVGQVYLPFLADSGIKIDENQSGWVAVVKPPHGSVIPSASCYFTFDSETDDDTPIDRSGYNRSDINPNGTIYGNPGRVGFQKLIGGSFTVSNTGVPSDSAEWTVAAWVRAFSGSETDGGARVNDSSGELLFQLYRVSTTGPSGLLFLGMTLDSGFVVPPGEWAHVAVTGNAGTYRAYLDGVPLPAPTTGFGTSSMASVEVTAFSDNASAIDEVGVWDRALSPAALAALAAGQRPPNVPQP